MLHWSYMHVWKVEGGFRAGGASTRTSCRGTSWCRSSTSGRAGSTPCSPPASARRTACTCWPTCSRSTSCGTSTCSPAAGWCTPLPDTGCAAYVMRLAPCTACSSAYAAPFVMPMIGCIAWAGAVAVSCWRRGGQPGLPGRAVHEGPGWVLSSPACPACGLQPAVTGWTTLQRALQ